MRLDDELVAPLRAVAERFALPKVRALHLPPREAVQAARRVCPARGRWPRSKPAAP